MKKIKIVVDSTADIPYDLLREYDIDTCPLIVICGDEQHLDRPEDFTTKDLYEYVEKTGNLPTTAAVDFEIVLETFKKYSKLGYQILYISIGSSFSRSYHNAVLAKEEVKYDDIYIIDSENVSSASGLLALKAYDLVNEGKDILDIVDILNDTKKRVHTNFVINTLDYLQKGGRASNFEAAIGKTLRIKPVLHVRNSELFVYKKTMGKLKKGIDIQLNDLLKEFKNNNLCLDNILIPNADNPEDVQYMIDFMNKNNIKPKRLIVSDAGCVITSHCGKKTIGVIYEVIKNNEKKSKK